MPNSEMKDAKEKDTKDAGRIRRPKARHRDVVFGAIEERLAMLEIEPSALPIHAARLGELFDELRRSLASASAGEPE